MDNILKIEIADDPFSRQQGLMYRKSLDSNSGMLFKFPQSDVLSFWGMNTYLNLDIAFVDENNKIIKIDKIKPFDLSSVSSQEKCIYAIETNYNFFKDNNILVGDIIKIEKDLYNYPIVKFEKNNIKLAKMNFDLNFLPTHKKKLEYKFIKDGDIEKMPPLSYLISDKNQRVITMTSDGKETENNAKPDDIIMSGPSSEKYVLKPSKFNENYDGKIGDTVTTKQNTRMVAVYHGEPTSFKAPWGEQMVIKDGDYLVKEGENEYYRIAKKEYEQTYNQPGE